jgi:hypothetical protein
MTFIPKPSSLSNGQNIGCDLGRLLLCCLGFDLLSLHGLAAADNVTDIYTTTNLIYQYHQPA